MVEAEGKEEEVVVAAGAVVQEAGAGREEDVELGARSTIQSRRPTCLRRIGKRDVGLFQETDRTGTIPIVTDTETKFRIASLV